MTINQVCETYSKKVISEKITIQTFQENETDIDMILIEGEAEVFRFLGNLFLAHAESEDCTFHIGPQLAGRIFFSDHSTYGLYLHRLPCVDKPDFRMATND